MIEYFNSGQIDVARKPRWWLWVLIKLGWLIAGPGAVVLVALAISAAAGTKGDGGYFEPLFLLLVLICLAMLARAVRRARAMIAVNYLEQAVRLNLPIPAMLQAARLSETGALRRRLERVIVLLERGSPVGLSLQRGLPGIPPRVVGMTLAGEHLGGLPAALRRVVSQEWRLFDRRPSQAIFLRWYPLVMLLAIGVVSTMMSVFVMPKYAIMLHDFDIPYPAVARWLMDVWSVVESPLLIFAGLTAIVFCGRMASELFPWGSPWQNPFAALTDRLAWTVPLWRGIARNRSLADVCHLLAEATDAGQQFDRALIEAAEACPNLVFRRRVARWGELASGGRSLSEAAREAGMPAILVGMLATAHGTAETANVLRFLCVYYDNRYSTAAALLQGAAIPLMVGFLAVIVAIIALGLFVPLVHLQEFLVRPIGRY